MAMLKCYHRCSMIIYHLSMIEASSVQRSVSQHDDYQLTILIRRDDRSVIDTILSAHGELPLCYNHI